jgi:ribonuclease J
MADLYGWVRPRTIIPVHGEPLHLAEHADLARKLGINHLTCRNGDLIQLVPGPPSIVDEVPAARLYKDGSLLIEAEGRTVADRRRLGFAGIVSVAFALTERGDLASDPDVELTGIPLTTADGKSMVDVAFDAVVETIETLPKARKRDPDAVAESVTRAVRAAIAGHWSKKPTCHVHVLQV